MWRYLICSLLGCCFISMTEAQPTNPFAPIQANDLEVFQVRVNHKTGFARFFNTPGGDLAYVLIEPRYDYIQEDYLPYHDGDLSKPIPSPYRLFETDEQVGILNRALREVLPARYQQIRILGDHLFAVEESGQEGFAMIDTAGRYLLNGMRFEDLHIGVESWKNPSPRFVFFKKDGLWGVCRLSGEVVIPPGYTAIQPSGLSGCFKVGAGKDLWKAVDSTGAVLIPQPMEDLQLLSANMFLGFDGLYWRRLTNEGNGSYRAGAERFVQVEKLNTTMAVLVSQVDDQRFAAALWRVHERPAELKRVFLKTHDDLDIQKLITLLKTGNSNTGQQWFFPLDDDKAFQMPSGNGLALVDTAGGETRLPYNWIQSSGFPGIYKIWSTSFGLYHLPTSRVLQVPAFASISNIEGRIAFAQSRGTSQLLGIADTGLVIYPVAASKIVLQDSNMAVLQLPGTSMTVSFSADGTFTEEFAQTRLMRVSSNADRPLREAEIIEKVKLPPSKGIPHKTDTIFIKKDNNTWFLFKAIDKNNGRPGSEKEIQRIPIPSSLALWKAEEVLRNKLVALFYRDARYMSPLISTYQARQAVTRLYDTDRRAFIGDSSVLGFRRFDSLYQYTAFIDQHGRMGLMDRKGIELQQDSQPLRYTYIGRFVAGRARVALGGQLALNHPKPLDQPFKFEIARHEQFLDEFQALPTQRLSQSMAQAGVYVVSTPESPVRWGYINEQGQLYAIPEADYLTDYQEQDSTAFYLRYNRREAFGRPDADYGLLDHQGLPLTPAKYSQITRIEDMLLVEADSTPTFYFTPKGVELFVNPTRLRPFSEGYAQFMDPNTRLWGYLDSTGRVAIPPAFSYARSFSEGRAVVANPEGFLVVIDPGGHQVFATNIPVRMSALLGDFKSGRCWFKGPSGWLWGCYDRDGRVVFEPKYHHTLKSLSGSAATGYEFNPLPMDYFDGRALVRVASGEQHRYHLIDSTGRITRDLPELRHAGGWQPSGFAVFSSREQKQGIINRFGDVVVPPAHTEIRPFINGFAAVKTALGKWGLVDTLGRQVLEAKYSAVDTVSEGLVKVKYPNSALWYYLDTTGRQVFPSGFEQAGTFSEGMTLVKSDKGMQIMDREGRVTKIAAGAPVAFSEGIFCIEEPRGSIKWSYFSDAKGNNRFGRYFAEVMPFQQGVAGFRSLLDGRRKSSLGAINRRGVMVVPPKYRKLHIQPDGSIITNPQRFYGLLDTRGRELLPPDYDRLERYEDPTLFRVERGESIGYLRVRESVVNWVWPLQK